MASGVGRICTRYRSCTSDLPLSHTELRIALRSGVADSEAQVNQFGSQFS